MIPLTIFVAIIAIVVALSVKRPTALAVLICSMMLYPDYLRIPVGLMKMSVPRLVALALLFQLASTARQRGFRWRFIDSLICFEWLWSVTANLLAGTNQTGMSEVTGRVFDTVLMYFVARLCLSRTSDYRNLVGPLIACSVIAGGLGVSEALTHHSPYLFLQRYSVISGFEAGFEGRGELRYGLTRAQVATSTSLYFGMAMVALLGMVYAARGFTSRKWIWVAGSLAAILGSVSSMSSGPQSALIVFTGISIFFLFPRMIKPAIGALVTLIILGEIASNRPFWFWIEYLNPAGGDSWYRSQLITVAIAKWRDYWLIGVGSGSVNYWGELIDGRLFVDGVNEYVMVGLNSGFLGLAIRLGIQFAAVRHAIRTYRVGDLRERQLAFTLAATVIAFMVGGLSVGSYGPPLLLMYILFGMTASRPANELQLAASVARRQPQVEARRELTSRPPVPISARGGD